MSSMLDVAAATLLADPGSSPTPELLDAIRASAHAGDETADLVACHDLMLHEGLFHILVPRELGGAGGTATDWFDAGLAVAGADPSAGWIMLQGAVQSAWMAVSADPSFASAFFAVRQTIATSSAGKRPPSATGTTTSSATPAGPTCRALREPPISGEWCGPPIRTENSRPAWCSSPQPRPRSIRAGTPTACAAPAATTSTSATR